MNSLLYSKAVTVGVLAGVLYGIVARSAVGFNAFGGAFAAMTYAYLFLVPVVLGALTVFPIAAPSLAFRTFAPWVPTLLVVAVSVLIGWEGSICIVMALPILLLGATIGGYIGSIRALRRWSARSIVVAMPFLVAPLEQRVEARTQWIETVSEITIVAPVAAVWPLVVSVDSIRPDEQRPALYTSIGFPRPISATISGSGVGAIRAARFERGLVFTETVTRWEPERLLSFSIDPNTESIPPTTLDPHVTIGGPFFDVLTGTYELHPTDGGRATRLVLRSQHRVSTRFNFYAVLWVDRVMASIQQNILRVHKARAEHSRLAERCPPGHGLDEPCWSFFSSTTMTSIGFDVSLTSACVCPGGSTPSQ